MFAIEKSFVSLNKPRLVGINATDQTHEQLFVVAQIFSRQSNADYREIHITIFSVGTYNKLCQLKLDNSVIMAFDEVGVIGRQKFVLEFFSKIRIYRVHNVLISAVGILS